MGLHQNHQRILFPIAVLFVVFTFLPHPSEGIKCFVCNSRYDKECDNSTVPQKYLVTCGPTSAYSHMIGQFTPPPHTVFTFCRKNLLDIGEQDNGDTINKPQKRTIRSCGYLNKTAGPTCDWAAGSSNGEFMCQCQTDGCNGAIPLATSWVTIFTSISGVTLFFIRSFIF